MGRIKTTLVKRNAVELVQKYKDKFSDNFDDNKKALVGLAELNSKKLRNVLVGYITRLIRRGQE